MARESPRRLDRLQPLLGRWLYPRADAIVAVSNAVAQDLAQVSKLLPDSITVIGNPVDTELFAARSTAPVALPQFAPGRPPVVLGVGRLVPEKDFALLVRAFAEMAPSHSAQLVILGEGPERGALTRLVDDLGLADRVSLPGFVNDLPGYLGRAAVVVLTSRLEGFGNVLVEAMACRTPVVSVDCPGGPAEILGGGAFGSLVTPDDPPALGTAIEKMLLHPTPQDRLRARSSEFSISRITSRYLEVLLAGGSPGPG
jgi:glycosyltransferase involved in cell wall biosynthesis